MVTRAYLHNESPPEAAVHPVALGANATESGEIIDTEGFDGVEFVIQVGAGDKAVDAKVESGAESDLSDAADIAGAAITQIANDATDVICVISVFRPAERYVRLEIATADEGTTDRDVSATARKYSPSGRIPVTDLADETVEVAESV